MKASNTLIQPFLDGILKDIRDFFPDDDFSYEADFISTLDTLNGALVVNELARIGKLMEGSLITGGNFSSNSDLLPVLDGASYPRLLSSLFGILFHYSGSPHFVSSDIEGISLDIDYDVRNTTKNHDVKALAVLCLRQFFLGLSKLETLECL